MTNYLSFAIYNKNNNFFIQWQTLVLVFLVQLALKLIHYTIGDVASSSNKGATHSMRLFTDRLSRHLTIILLGLLFILGSKDDNPPVITLLGDNPVTVLQGETYQDAGAIAIDETDGNLTVSKKGLVDTLVVGSYHLNYSATNSQGNTATVTRTVKVTAKAIDTTPPTVPILSTPAPTETFEDQVSVEIKGEISSLVYLNTQKIATMAQDGKARLTLKTQGKEGLKTFKITLKDTAGNESTPLVIQITKKIKPSGSAYLPKIITNKIAVNFLSLASFGATETSSAALKKKGVLLWLEEQLALPYQAQMHLKRMLILSKKVEPDKNPATVSTYLADNETVFNKAEGSFQSRALQMSALFQTILFDKDQLRHRTAYALSQIIVESLAEPTFIRRAEALAVYFDLLTQHAFGNYKDLLLDISHSASMAAYLTYNGNKKAYQVGNTTIYPDENYARELMQLFTIGLNELNLDGSVKLDAKGNSIPTYTQQDVNEVARIFTGWDIKRNKRYGRLSAKDGDFTHPIEFTEKYHDLKAKTVLGTPIPAGNTGTQDIEAVINILMAHPNIAPFISKQLIMRLSKSNPSPAYIARISTVFNDNGQGVKGDLKAVVKAIFLDRELWENQGNKKFKEPFLAYTQFLRAFKIKPLPRWRTAKTSTLNIDNMLYIRDPSQSLGQAPSRAFTVFNFYSNDYLPNDNVFQQALLVAPELQIQTDNMLIAFNQRIYADLSTEESVLKSKYGNSLNDWEHLKNQNFRAVFSLYHNKFILNADDEYRVMETALETTVDGKFQSFKRIKRSKDTTADATGTTDRDRAIKALIQHLDLKLTGGLLASNDKNILFNAYKESFYGGSMIQQEDPKTMIYNKIIRPIITAIITSETYMVQ